MVWPLSCIFFMHASCATASCSCPHFIVTGRGLLYKTDFSSPGVLDFCLNFCPQLYPVILFCLTSYHRLHCGHKRVSSSICHLNWLLTCSPSFTAIHFFLVSLWLIGKITGAGKCCLASGNESGVSSSGFLLYTCRVLLWQGTSKLLNSEGWQKLSLSALRISRALVSTERRWRGLGSNFFEACEVLSIYNDSIILILCSFRSVTGLASSFLGLGWPHSCRRWVLVKNSGIVSFSQKLWNK